MKFLRVLPMHLLFMVLFFILSTPMQANVPKVGILWTFAENEKGTNDTGIRTAQDFLRRLFEEKAGFEVASEGLVRATWQELGYPTRPLTVEDPGQVPLLPEPKQLLVCGEKANLDYVCAITLTWRVRSIWVGLGPKTKVDATVSALIVDVKNAQVALEARDVNSDSTASEKWYQTAGALLVSWGFTLFSGGPKTPHIQKAAIKAVGTATDAFFTTKGKAIQTEEKQVSSYKQAANFKFPQKTSTEVAELIAQRLKEEKEERAVLVLEFRIRDISLEAAKSLSETAAEDFRTSLTLALAEEGVKLVRKAEVTKAMEELLQKNTEPSEDEVIKHLQQALPNVLIIAGTISQPKKSRWQFDIRVLVSNSEKPLAHITHYFEQK